MTLAVAVGAAGALGAVLRALVDGAVQRRARVTVPVGTLTVNVVGSLVIGFVTGLALLHGIGHTTLAVVGTGLCGGFTTWSAFTWETVRLAASNERRAVTLHVVVGLGASIAAAALGFALGGL